MTEILPSASYVQNRTTLRADAGKQSVLDDITDREESQRVWELLETPQTVETLARVISNEFDTQPNECERDITASMSRLYREDLIQVAPDA